MSEISTSLSASEALKPLNTVIVDLRSANTTNGHSYRLNGGIMGVFEDQTNTFAVSRERVAMAAREHSPNEKERKERTVLIPGRALVRNYVPLLNDAVRSQSCY